MHPSNKCCLSEPCHTPHVAWNLCTLTSTLLRSRHTPWGAGRWSGCAGVKLNATRFRLRSLKFLIPTKGFWRSLFPSSPFPLSENMFHENADFTSLRKWPFSGFTSDFTSAPHTRYAHKHTYPRVLHMFSRTLLRYYSWIVFLLSLLSHGTSRCKHSSKTLNK